MKIEFINEKVEDNFDHKEVGRIVIDDIKDPQSELIAGNLYVKLKETFEKLVQHSFQELEGRFDYITYDLRVDWCIFPLSISIRFPDHVEDNRSMSASFDINYVEWEQPYSIKAFVEKHKEIISGMADVKFIEVEDVRWEIIGSFFYLDVMVDNISNPLFLYVEYGLDKLKEAYLQALEELKSGLKPDTLSVLYNFPKEIAAACKQYLMYFAQFLADLGIEAETAIQADSKHVLFSVTPIDKNQALAEIYNALSIYVDAPNYPEDLSRNDIALIQWKANILHLKSQIELSRAIIQAKDETIETLKIANYQLQSFIPKNRKEEPMEKKSEEILGGLASVDDLKFKGVTIKLPELLRRLKRRFR